MKWTILADFFESGGDTWLDDFIDHDGLSFQKVPPPRAAGSWHVKRGARTEAREWMRHWRHAATGHRTRPDGFITCFPPLAMCVAAQKRLWRSKAPIVAHNFNLGPLAPGPRQRAARFAAQAIERFLVHSPLEVAPYAAYLGVPEARVEFVPLQRRAFPLPRDEETERPYILSMGSAQRDYPTLIRALEPLRIRTIIVTRPDAARQLPQHDWIEYRHSLSPEDCDKLLARARLSVTPVANMETASGQVTFIDAMRAGVAPVVTRCPGTEGYIEDGENGCLTAPFDADDMREKIHALWQDDGARQAMAERAATAATERFSDEAAAARLKEILLGVSRA